MQRELRLNVKLGQHVAGDLLSIPGGELGACVQEDLRVTRADSDGAAELAADVFFHLMLGQCLLRLFGLCLACEGDGYSPVIAVCSRHDSNAPQSQAAGWTGAAWCRITDSAAGLETSSRSLDDHAQLVAGGGERLLDFVPGARPRRR